MWRLTIEGSRVPASEDRALNVAASSDRDDTSDRYRISRRDIIAWTSLLFVADLPFSSAVCATAGPVAAALTGGIGDYYVFDEIPKLPAVTFENSAGQMHELAELRGRVVLLNFWATWCAPCVYEMRGLDELQGRFPKTEFLVLCLCEDSDVAATARFLRRHDFSHLDAFVDPKGRGRRSWSVPAIPTSFIVDRRGHVRGIMPGAAAWNSEAAQSLIAYYVSEG